MGLSFSVILFLAYAAGSVAGLIIMKAWLGPAEALWRAGSYVTMPTTLVALGAALYICSFLLWLAILTRNELSVAYPVAIALTLVLSTLASQSRARRSRQPIPDSGHGGYFRRHLAPNAGLRRGLM